LAELIINKRRERQGLKGLGGQELAQAVRRMIAGRIRSIAFLSSGWLPAVKVLLTRIQDKRGIKVDRSVKWYGKPKGRVTPASLSWRPQCTIENTVSKGQQAEAIINAGLQKAIDDETKSMLQYVESKLAKEAEQFNRA
jgi:hypothetical protein